jgi:hypothetical protein
VELLRPGQDTGTYPIYNNEPSLAISPTWAMCCPIPTYDELEDEIVHHQFEVCTTILACKLGIVNRAIA